MRTVVQDIDLDVPTDVAFRRWTQFETFPHFMDAIEEVRRIDDTRLHWQARIRGRALEWDAVVTERRPWDRVAWRSTSGRLNAGTVTFQRLGAESCRMQVRIEHESRSVMERIGSALGVDSAQVKRSLEQFKATIERNHVS